MRKIVPVASAIFGLALFSATGCATTGEEQVRYSAAEEEPVVGTRIKKRNSSAEKGATPVRVYSRGDMKSIGSRSVGDFVNGGGGG